MGMYVADMPVLSKEEQIKLASSKDVFERVHLARRGDLFLKAIEILSKDPDERVRTELAGYCVEPRTLNRMFKRDPSEEVKRIVQVNPYFQG